MSPEAKRSFEAEWAVLSRRLRLLLVRKRVAAAQHDDLLQETALRLVAMWDSVDHRRELWPLTVTIALNLLRDRGRIVNKDDLVGEMPEMRALTDVETAGIARLELSKVREAMDQLSEAHRSILMREIGGLAASTLPDSATDKMMRMRARRKLRSALERVSGLAALRARRLGDLFEGLVIMREAGVTVASCAFCLALGVGGTLLPPPGLLPEASAQPAGQTRLSLSILSRVEPEALVPIPRSNASASEPRPYASLTDVAAGDGKPATKDAVTRGRVKDQSDENTTTSDGDLLDDLPLGGGGDGTQGPGSVSLETSGETPPLPTGGEGDVPEPPAPSPPTAPPPPPPPPPPGGTGDSSADPLEAAELVDELL